MVFYTLIFFQTFAWICLRSCSQYLFHNICTWSLTYFGRQVSRNWALIDRPPFKLKAYKGRFYIRLIEDEQAFHDFIRVSKDRH